MNQRPDVLDDVPELKQAVNAVCAAAPSEARRKQIRAHARELVRALNHPSHPLTIADDLTNVFNQASMEAYERLALAGELRDRGPARPTAKATANVRSGVMALLQRELALEVVHLRSSGEQPRKTPVDFVGREVLRNSLRTVAAHVGRQTSWTIAGGLLTRGHPGWVRMLALASVVLDTGARVGELCALRLEDLSPALDEVRITRRPQNRRPQEPDIVEVYQLRPATRAALRRWCLVRRLLLAETTSGTGWLWVSIEEPGGVFGGRHSGTALQPLGVSRNYTRTVTTINAELAGAEGWKHLPVRMEQLRRGVDEPARFIVPHTPDSEHAAQLMERLVAAGRQLAVLSATTSLTTTGREALDEARQVLCEAWRNRIEHRVLLAALCDSGLTDVNVPLAGWEPELLRALRGPHKGAVRAGG
ncbi:hypothetical protein ACFVYG_20410 [Streptomyces sp. NPDC058256]|uniref:hypothetical protein n=1 Tax=Streptomyces sp. NPDC058256 TaxID=3346408 RepID=UPI0036E8EA2F